MQNITKIAKKYDKAVGYYHVDLDGVTSAIGMRTYLENYGIRTVKLNPVQYGSPEYAMAKPLDDHLIWMVDFANGKDFVKIHTDHHDRQTGVMKHVSTDFTQAASNAETISNKISPKLIFPPKDLEIISIVDSAKYSQNDISVDTVMGADFAVDLSKGVDANRLAMGLTVNKLILANKNKKGFLEYLIQTARPSLLSIYTILLYLIRINKIRSPEYVSVNMKGYIEVQGSNMKGNDVDPVDLLNGDSTLWGNTIVQYGGGDMKRIYDRYTPFKLYPDADYLCMGWPMGLVQVSKNPFKKGESPCDLASVVNGDILGSWKPKLQGMRVNVDDLKRRYEFDVKGWDSIGFKFEDLVALYEGKLNGINIYADSKFNDMVKDIMKVPHWKLSIRQRDILKLIDLNLYDIVDIQSGGHTNITNVSGINFYGKGYVDLILKPFMRDIAMTMKEYKLGE